MAEQDKDRFMERLQNIEEKAKPGARIERRVADDGLIVDVVKPARGRAAKGKSGRRGLLPYKAILVAACLGVLVKGVIFAQLGEDAYLAQIDTMRNGSAGEIAAAFLLDADPATRLVASFIGKFI